VNFVIFVVGFYVAIIVFKRSLRFFRYFGNALIIVYPSRLFCLWTEKTPRYLLLRSVFGVDIVVVLVLKCRL
jgi:hypothetical protein